VSRTTILLISGLCLAVGSPSPASAQDEKPPVFEMSNAPPPRPIEQPAEPAPVVVEEPSVEVAVEPAIIKPRTFALGVALLSEHALVSAVVRLRKNHIALDVSYGINPIIVTYTKPDSDKGDFGADMSWVHVDGSLVLFFNDDQKRFQNGLRFGSVYDQITGFGGMFGWVGELGFNRFALSFGAGLKAFPRYEERVRDHFDIDDESEVESFLFPLWLGVYFGINLRWYLF